MHRILRLLALLAASIFGSQTALAADSFRAVCSGFAELQVEGSTAKMGISIDFLDHRSGNSDRKYTLSSIYQSLLFQGSIIDSTGSGTKGAITLKNSSRTYFAGNFKLEPDKNQTYTLVLDGKLNQDPTGSKKMFPGKATLPCIDLSL